MSRCSLSLFVEFVGWAWIICTYGVPDTMFAALFLFLFYQRAGTRGTKEAFHLKRPFSFRSYPFIYSSAEQVEGADTKLFLHHDAIQVDVRIIGLRASRIVACFCPRYVRFSHVLSVGYSL